MGKAIVGALTGVALVAMLVGAYVWSVRHRFRGDLSVRQERQQRELLAAAGRVLSGLGVGLTVDDCDLLRPESRAAIDGWLAQYHTFQEEIHDA